MCGNEKYLQLAVGIQRHDCDEVVRCQEVRESTLVGATGKRGFLIYNRG